jgi:hypothetical protein
MGRLDDIVDRNKNPGKTAKNRFPLGLGVAVFVLIILILWIFTDLDESPDAKHDEPVPATEPAPVSRDHHVDGVLLYREKPRAPRDAGATQTAPSP